jgi:hypothetical protein
MGFFDDQVAREKIQVLETKLVSIDENLQKVQTTQNELDLQIKEVSKRAPDFEHEAKQASESAKINSATTQQALIEVNAIKEKLIEFKEQITKSKEEIEDSQASLVEYLETAENQKVDLTDKQKSINEAIISVQEKVGNFESIFANHPELEVEIEHFEEIIFKIKDSEAKSNQLVKGINTRVIELETLYNEILGYIDKDENGEERIVKGLKQELEIAFDGLDSKRTYLEGEYQRIESNTKENLNGFSSEYNLKLEAQLKNWDAKYTSLNKKIEALLPNALTAGLSYAFSEKKADEIKSHDNYKNLFQKAIYGLIAVSAIPFIISVCSIFMEVSLDTVINRVPKIVIAILPLYIPVLWFAISSSKKMNLSKRLIEEYTHKEVLSKTYEGLSKQIENLESDDNAFDLRTKLLQNFLLMYSENPGKLISDYNKTDHPIMELLENSNKLEATVQKLENIPGLSKLSKLLEAKSKKKLEQVANKVEKGIDKALAINEEGDSNTTNNG